MAYVRDEDEEHLAGQPQQGPEKVLSTGSTPAPDDGKTPQPAQGQPAEKSPQQKGTGWTNLVNYVNANKEAGQKMGQKTAGVVDTTAAKSKEQQTGYKNSAANLIAAGSATRDQTIIDDIANDPTKITGDREKTFQEMMAAQYKGPNAAQEVEQYQDADSSVRNTAQKADSLSDFEARRGVISEAYGNRADYTAGESRLDSFLTGRGGGDQLAKAQTEYGNKSDFKKGWGDLVGRVTGDIKKAHADADSIQQDTRNTLKAATDNIDKTFSSYSAKANEANTDNAGHFRALNRKLGSKNKNARAEAFAEIGLDIDTGDWLRNQGYNLQQLIQAGKELKAGDFAKQGDVDRMQALYRLGGKQVDKGLFDKSGSDGSSFYSNDDAINTASKAKKIEDDINQALKEAQSKRAAEYDSYAKGLSSWDQKAISATGLSPEQAALARELGVDLSSLATKGKDINIGDVATKEQRQGWANLMSSLGLDAGRLDLMDKQNEGAAFGFDKNKYNAAFNQKASDYIRSMSGGNSYGGSGNIDLSTLGKVIGIDMQDLAGTSLFARQYSGGMDQGWAVPEMDPANFITSTPTGDVFDRNAYVHAANNYLASVGSPKRIQ